MSPEARARLPSAASERIDAFNAQAKKLDWPFACAIAGDFKDPHLTAVYALWREKARDRAMPDRADLTARAMKPFLTNMSLIERVATDGPPRYRLRYHGTTLARYAGDGTGKYLDDIVHPDRIGGYTVLYDLVLELFAPLRVASSYQAPEIAYLTGESFVAPLGRAEGPLILSVTYPKPRSELPQPLSGSRL